MAISISGETLLSYAEAARSLPGRGVNVSTIWRWVTRGVKGIRLETVTIGGRRFTSREALERFTAATTAATSGEALTNRTSKQRELATSKADQELAKSGW